MSAKDSYPNVRDLIKHINLHAICHIGNTTNNFLLKVRAFCELRNRER